MANTPNRAILACSASALAIAIVVFYYWHSRKRRKTPEHIGILSGDQPIESNSLPYNLDKDDLLCHSTVEPTVDQLIEPEEIQEFDCVDTVLHKETHTEDTDNSTDCDQAQTLDSLLSYPDTSVVEDKTMHLKSNESLSSAFVNVNSSNDGINCKANDDQDSQVIEPIEHVSNSQNNSILSTSIDQTIDVDKSATSESSFSDQTDKTNCELRRASLSEPVDLNCASDDSCLPNGTDSGKSSVLEDIIKCPKTQPVLAAKVASSDATLPPVDSSCIKLSQTFAQVLSSAPNSRKASEPKMASFSQTAQKAINPACDEEAQSPSRDDVDIYHNYPESNSPSSDSPLHGEEHDVSAECNDVRSQGSNDSGKGSCNEPLNLDSANVSPKAQSVNDDQVIQYNFEMPFNLCGKLIGTHGHFINSVKESSDTQIVVSPLNGMFKICTIIGKQSNVDIALGLIRSRFPVKLYPDVTLRKVEVVQTPTIPLTQACQLHLPTGILTDVILSCTINAGHFFLQQPTHPTYPKLAYLDHTMSENYSLGDAPTINPDALHQGIICAAQTEEGWFRALIKAVYDTAHECDIMFVDYGGFAFNVPLSSLRQIRYDFLSLPFQASECFLAGVTPIDEQTGWSDEANSFFEKLAQGQLIYAQIVDYSKSGVSLVNLYKVEDQTQICINQSLIEKGFAKVVSINEQL